MRYKVLPIAILVFLLMAINVNAQKLMDAKLFDAITNEQVALKNDLTNGNSSIIVFWATWNAISKTEIRKLSKLMEENGSKANLIVISVDKPVTKGLVKTYAETQQWKFPAYRDDGGALLKEILEDDEIGTPPLTVIMDRNGNVIHMHRGFEIGDETIIFEKVPK